MEKLEAVDYEQFIFQGEFERFNKIPPHTFLDEKSAINAVDRYNEWALGGQVFGSLNDGFLLIPTADGEQVDGQQKEPAFMILKVWWDSKKKSVNGQIMILDSNDGQKIKSRINEGAECYISSSKTLSGSNLDSLGRAIYQIIELDEYQISLIDRK